MNMKTAPLKNSPFDMPRLRWLNLHKRYLAVYCSDSNKILNLRSLMLRHGLKEIKSSKLRGFNDVDFLIHLGYFEYETNDYVKVFEYKGK